MLVQSEPAHLRGPQPWRAQLRPRRDRRQRMCPASCELRRVSPPGQHETPPPAARVRERLDCSPSSRARSIASPKPAATNISEYPGTARLPTMLTDVFPALQSPWNPSTTLLLDAPSAMPTRRPVRNSAEAAPLRMLDGSRTETGSGPAVMPIWLVFKPIAVDSAKQSQLGPSPTHISPNPSRSAATAMSWGSEEGEPSLAAATTLKSIAESTVSARHAAGTAIRI
jgi:hypothetical protein